MHLSEAALTQEIAEDILRKLGRTGIVGIIEIEQTSGHKDEEAPPDDNEDIREQDSGDEDEEAIHDDNEDIREQDSCHEDEEAINDDNVDIREQASGHEDEEAIHDDNVDNREQDRGDEDEEPDHTVLNIREPDSSHEAEEAIHDPKITAERMFVATNLILEVPSVVFDKLSSVHKPQYALVSMLMSFMTMLICIIQLVYQGREGGVGWKRREKIPWFYYPSDKPFGTVTDFIGLLCAIFQSIFTAIGYALYLRNINDPIKISIWPLVFSFCLMCSTFFKESPKKDALTESTVPTDDIV